MTEETIGRLTRDDTTLSSCFIPISSIKQGFFLARILLSLHWPISVHTEKDRGEEDVGELINIKVARHKFVVPEGFGRST
jgi:hypothetical protein